jgi:hypothetical protein
MKKSLSISNEERNRISKLHESAIKREIISEQPYIADMGKWEKFPCVMQHKDAKRAKLSDGTFAFFIGKDVYYNNGRKKLADGTMANYSCNDEIFKSSAPVEVSPETPAEVSPETTSTTTKQPLSYYVKEAQKLIGMPESEQDGKFGPKTLEALQNFLSKINSAEKTSTEDASEPSTSKPNSFKDFTNPLVA